MNQEINWKIKKFSQLDTEELYGLLNLRSEIFVVEQNIVYIDTDYKDQEAIHLIGYINKSIVAYCRIFNPGDYFDNHAIGRVVVKENYRKKGYGHLLMKKAIEIIGNKPITISAQLYLQKFYESHGFQVIGDVYLEDTIEHVRMDRTV